MKPHRPPARAQAGFTLIEVLAALSLMALVSLLAWRGLDRLGAARAHLAAQAEDTDAIARSLGQLSRDIQLSYHGPAFDAPPRDARAITTGLRLLRGTQGEMLEILRPDAGGAGLWQRVRWQVKPDGLWRASGPAAARSPLPDTRDGALLLPGVRAMRLRLWVRGRGWVDAASTLTIAPAGLEITLERGAAPALRYTRVLELP
ncbi:type II secretion system protein GspJ [Achromobacter sp. Marseille-Q4962]|uniref:PulJ/GspJ family protein n=1 Tax=Achromobacter sp. Marseille-Q4962 TaxID=2942202 RepID=UPI002073561A|nr:type II secretion system protein GspJ [Achromobacter sp. Marseille-Q4962]